MGNRSRLGKYFYSRPCGRGDVGRFAEPHIGVGISTHAPAGGATYNRFDYRWDRHISTHAPAGGATLKTSAILSGWRISTHAPAGGATFCEEAVGRTVFLFLLTPLREGRLTIPEVYYCVLYFYSRPCGRGDVRKKTGSAAKQISTHAPAGGATTTT